MITELTRDLINKIKTVSALQNRVGAAVGGTEADPTMSDAPTPFAWVVYGGDQPAGVTGKDYREVSYLFTVMVTVGYGNGETDLFDVQYPTLEAISQAVSGLTSVQYADDWSYQGSNLIKILPDRLIFQMNFDVIGYHKV